MNLIVDIGNSCVKIAVADNKGIVVSQCITDDIKELENIIRETNPGKAIISSVKEFPEGFSGLINKKIKYVHVLSHKSRLPFSIGYRTPETLGTDRIAAIAGAYNHFGGTDSLVIDAGTAIKYDVLLSNCFKGGNISPGIDIRFKALHNFTGKLPLIEKTHNYNSPGGDTAEAITAGVINGVIYEINEYIRTFEVNYPGIRVILTGGDGSFLHNKLDHKTDYLPGIVIKGLNFILEYNAK
ncbi:MAG TPA: type III pantothenate kinase [Bacteroidales bacterium]|nr:type III pantothenate kinase [Bacteroidales bacterium]